MPKNEKSRNTDKALAGEPVLVDRHSITYAVLQSICASDAERRRMFGRIKGGSNRWRNRQDDPLLKDIVDCIESHAPKYSEGAINGILKERFSGKGKPGHGKFSPARLRLITKAVLEFVANENQR